MRVVRHLLFVAIALALLSVRVQADVTVTSFMPHNGSSHHSGVCDENGNFCDSGCCGNVQFWFDANVLSFSKTGGVRVGNDVNEEAQLDGRGAPRFNFRYDTGSTTYVA